MPKIIYGDGIDTCEHCGHRNIIYATDYGGFEGILCIYCRDELIENPSQFLVDHLTERIADDQP